MNNRILVYEFLQQPTSGTDGTIAIPDGYTPVRDEHGGVPMRNLTWPEPLNLHMLYFECERETPATVSNTPNQP